MSVCVSYPAPGCIVEYMEGNAVQIAMVLEESGGRVRLLLPNRRELRLSATRLLPWLGPATGAGASREEAVQLLERHRAIREAQTAGIDVQAAWELAQGELDSADARWFAELFHPEPDADQVAAQGRALLACKSRFRFQPPLFEIFDAETVARREEEQRQRAEREALTAGGAAFLRLLWDIASRRRQGPPAQAELPPPDVAERLKKLLMARLADPESMEDAELWRIVSKGLPPEPHVPLQLLMAWGVLPRHYNFWLDRADYAPGDEWWRDCAGEVEELIRAGAAADLPLSALPFISIDGPTTRDVDDAFSISPLPDGWRLTVALANPAYAWAFGGQLDRLVQRRATSIYLPEGTCHMLPEILGLDACSLLAGRERPALCLAVDVDRAGRAGRLAARVERVCLDANLNYSDCQAVLDAIACRGEKLDNPASAHAAQLEAALALARARQQARIGAGAVIMERPEQEISLQESDGEILVEIAPEDEAADARMLVAEMMILASASLAEWAREENIPLFHRAQDVALPKEYAGIWRKPEDMARIMRALIPSSLEVQPRPHAALGVPRYAPVTSPLRRYPDMINEAQASHFLSSGSPRWQAGELEKLLEVIRPALDGAGQVQRFRPRYWRLLHVRQQGDRKWWPGVVTDENEAFVTVNLPDIGLIVRGKRRLFDERACPGTPVEVRLGRVNPLYNEIQIMEAARLE